MKVEIALGDFEEKTKKETKKRRKMPPLYREKWGRGRDGRDPSFPALFPFSQNVHLTVP